MNAKEADIETERAPRDVERRRTQVNALALLRNEFIMQPGSEARTDLWEKFVEEFARK